VGRFSKQAMNSSPDQSDTSHGRYNNLVAIKRNVIPTDSVHKVTSLLHGSWNFALWCSQLKLVSLLLPLQCGPSGFYSEISISVATNPEHLISLTPNGSVYVIVTPGGIGSNLGQVSDNSGLDIPQVCQPNVGIRKK
jgi:hypothetical protein